MARSSTYLSDLETDYRQIRGDEDSLSERELEALYEGLEEPASQSEFDEGEPSAYGQRFYELSTRQFESDQDRDAGVQEILNEMERQYFFKKLFKKIKRGGLKGLVGKALKIAGGIAKIPGVGSMIPGLSTITNLARGNLKGALGSLASSGFNMLVPGSGAIAGPALAALGFGEVEDPQAVSQEWWNRYAEVSKRSMENLADNATDNFDSFLEASQAGASAIQNAVSQVRNVRGVRRADARHIRLRPGERVIIEVE